MGWHILLVQGLDIAHCNPTDRVVHWRIRGMIQVQINSIPFNDGKTPIVVRVLKAQLSIESQRLLHILNGKPGCYAEQECLIAL